jgi:hypothetical protein
VTGFSNILLNNAPGTLTALPSTRRRAAQ